MMRERKTAERARATGGCYAARVQSARIRGDRNSTRSPPVGSRARKKTGLSPSTRARPDSPVKIRRRRRRRRTSSRPSIFLRDSVKRSRLRCCTRHWMQPERSRVYAAYNGIRRAYTTLRTRTAPRIFARLPTSTGVTRYLLACFRTSFER